MKNVFIRIRQSQIKFKILLVILAFAAGYGVYRFTVRTKTNIPQYQTTTVEKGTLIVSVTASGQVSSANSAEVSTQASGVVKTVYVKDGDTVKKGDAIALLDLDLTGQQRSQSAYAGYQSAKNNVDSARAAMYTSQATLLKSWESYMAKAQNATYENADDTPNTSNRQLSDFVITQDDWLASEAKYKIQEQAISQTLTALSSSWYSYQQTSPTIVAPISGTVTGLSLQPGTVITAQTNSTGGSSSQRIASVKTDAPPTVSLNLTQIDAPKIKAGQKATVTFDAFADKTFTGEVVSIDTIGSQSSGVTTYPAIITLDSKIEGLLPNMSASATIITATKTDALLVPSSAVTTSNGISSVQILKNTAAVYIEVTTGLYNDTRTEIISGLSEGDTIVTGTVTSGSATRSPGQSSSPFSPFGRTGMGSGGNVIRMNR